MLGQRAPWWMYLLAASYLGRAALIVYVEFRGPESTGIEFASIAAPGPAVAARIRPGSPADRAGIRPGDRLVRIDRHSVTDTFKWLYALSHAEVGRPMDVRIERNGEMRDLSLRLMQKPVGSSDVSDWVRISRALFCLGLALVIAFSRPYNLQARVGAWLLAEVGMFGLVFLNIGLVGMEAVAENLPTPIAVLLALSRIAPGGALLFAFAAVFPRPLFHGWAALILVWFPQALMMFVRAIHEIYLRESLLRYPAWIKPAGALYLVGAVVVFVANYKRLDDINERRRARIVAAGTAALVAAVLPYILLISPGAPAERLEAVFLSTGTFVALNVLSLLFPIAVAYAILRHRAFDIAVVIRQGLQYAVARRAVLAVIPVLAAILVADLLMHGNQPLTIILQERGWIYGGLAAAALAANRYREQWMNALDRRFFRDRYDAQRILREVGEEVRAAASFDQAASRVVSRIESALHTDFAAILTRRPNQPYFRVIAAAPITVPMPPLPEDSKLLSMMRVLGKPMNLNPTETGWLQQQLPSEESELFRQSRIEWLIPVGPEALLAVGSKRSEEPFTRDDLDVLLAISASLSLLLHRATLPSAVPNRGFCECTRCGSLYDLNTDRCSLDGSELMLTRVPRLLADRYRLDRRLGGGGMGTVYEATDTALERRVAIKVLREELAASDSATERFRREARIAAAFAHANVVTVHDFGVADDRRAFLVMERLEGRDLRQELKARRSFPPQRALAIMRGVCAGLQAAHERGLTHRDVKPENIFLARSAGTDVPKILDFGIAKAPPALGAGEFTTTTAVGQIAGTPRYMSPEQLCGGRAASTWDLWALAIVAYEMLSGDYPLDATTMAEWHASVMRGSPKPLAYGPRSGPNELDEFFARALGSDQRERPRTANELVAELETALRNWTPLYLSDTATT